MTATKPQVRDLIIKLRRENYTYEAIAERLGISVNTIQSICRRAGVVVENKQKKDVIDYNYLSICASCGQPFSNPHHRKTKRFCSQQCRWDFNNARKMEAARIAKAQQAQPQLIKEKTPECPDNGLDIHASESVNGGRR